MDQKIEKILAQFDLPQGAMEALPYGNGHINDTLCVSVYNEAGCRRYIMQRVNNYVFPKPVEVIENIEKVTAYLRGIIQENGGDVERETLTLLRGDGVNVFSKNRIDLGETANVLRGQKIGSRAAPSDGIALITSSKTGLRGLRIPGVIQYCREGEWVRAPASEPEGVKVTFFPFVGKEGR